MTRRFSVLPYANALPLVHFIGESSPEARLSYYPPRRSVAALLNGQADAALIPVVDFFAYHELRMVRGLGICADGDVTSVLLQCPLDFNRVDYPRISPPEWEKYVTLKLEDGQVVTADLPLDYYLREPYASTFKENYEVHASLQEARTV